MKPLLAMTVLTALLAPLALAGIQTDYDHSAHFDRYRTFAWRTSAPNPPNGMLNNSLVYARITQAVDQQLVKKGWREVTQNPDVYLTYKVSASAQETYDSYPAYGWGGPRWGWGGGWGYGWGGGWWGAGDAYFDPYYLQGNFTIDMVDAHTNLLIWRAYGTDSGFNLSNIESAKNIDKIVTKAFNHFPPEYSPAA